LCHGIALVFRCFRLRIVEIATAKVDILRRIGDFLACAFLSDESADILFNLAIFQCQTYLLARLTLTSAPMLLNNSESTYSVIADTDGRCDIRKAPETTLHKIEPFLFEILEFLFGVLALYKCLAGAISYVARGFPVPIPSAGCFFQCLNGILILCIGSCDLNLSLL
jgi:hypothetical protein